MNLYKITTDDKFYIVLAETSSNAEICVVNKDFAHLYDDELSDVMTTEEIASDLPSLPEAKILQELDAEPLLINA